MKRPTKAQVKEYAAAFERCRAKIFPNLKPHEKSELLAGNYSLEYRVNTFFGELRFGIVADNLGFCFAKFDGKVPTDDRERAAAREMYRGFHPENAKLLPLFCNGGHKYNLMGRGPLPNETEIENWMEFLASTLPENSTGAA